ncbi:hypothetical protein JHV666_08970 [Mycobacterium avium subsp. hominissuis]|nr:hypothetical protein MINTM003_01290 [Mycobacterium paraintracellulare]BCO81783.1 hypothetical protein MINTM011_01180 [Mycobacterium paraintracellulare]BCO86877.1 hypothetical protein MINTM015_01340 [Mycobacterium paraintracellulare]
MSAITTRNELRVNRDELSRARSDIDTRNSLLAATAVIGGPDRSEERHVRSQSAADPAVQFGICAEDEE